MSEIVKMQLNSGIKRFKCATIAELEMCLEAGAKHVLMAYPLVGPKTERFIALTKKYPGATVASLVDNVESATALADSFSRHGIKANVYFDINNGQNRTGYQLNENTFKHYSEIQQIKNLNLIGLHVYDGHIRDSTLAGRKSHSDKSFEPIYSLLEKITTAGFPVPEIITGGSPSFSSALQRAHVFCSPGTTLLWDWGYSTLVTEVDMQWAAVLLTRIISKPAPGLVTTDLGHKSVGSENPIEKRIKFLNLDGAEPFSQSEEHLVLKVNQWEALKVGQVLYGIPFHVCPSVALHDEAHIIRDHSKTEVWNVVARKRKITV
ncbi:MAG TPA: alanine racemase, partial [Cyclobacteriaceae bacterium]|nr:alanine racemase [Cyclobacteriaceae bacterium]